MKTFITATACLALTGPVLAGIPIGRGDIFASTMATTTYDSNVYGTPDATADFSGTLAPRLSYLRQAALVESEANVGVAIIRYLEETALDTENFDANAALRFPVSAGRNFSGSLSAAYLETSDLDTDLNTRVNTASVTFEARTALVTGPRSDVALNASYNDSRRDVTSDRQTLASEFAYGYRDFFYGNNLRIAANYDRLETSGDNTSGIPLDQTAYMLTVGLNRLIAHDTLRVGVNYGYRILERSAAETTSGETRQTGSVISASIDGPFLPKKYFPKVESRFGVTYQEASSPGIDDEGSKDITGFLKRRALDDARIRGVIFGHAGDGHAHVNPLIDVREPDWRARMEQLITDVTILVASLGGTLAGEHGDGRLRAALHDVFWHNDAREAFAATKQAFDPLGILNPGVVVAAAGAKPLEDIKYDPNLPALPRAARAALDAIVKEKGWGRFRLDLISRALKE